MSIKPVDMQVLMPKALEVSRLQNDEHGRNQAMIQQQAGATQNKVEENLKQVYSREKTQEARIREKRERQERESKKKKSKGTYRMDGKDSKEESGGLQSSTIDIKI